MALTTSMLVAGLVAAPPAWADGASGGGDLHVAQSLGDRELTVVIRRVDPVPGPLRVEVVSHAGTAPGVLALRAASIGASNADRPPGSASQTTVTLGTTPGVYAGTMRVDQAGAWELAVDDGERVARIPFLVPARFVTPWERAAYGGFAAAGLLLAVSLLVAVRSRRGWPALIPAAGVIAAVAVGLTGALLSASAPPPQPAGRLLDPSPDTIGDPYPERALSTTDYSRPPVNLVLRNDSSTLALTVTDSATGRPADDLLVHDNALIHLMIVGPTGRLWHLHPIRTGPGGYEVRFAPSETGEYAVAAELSRRGGGVQLIRSSFTAAAAQPADPPRRDAGQITATPLVAAGPSTITARLGGPADLQPWLGMVGHLIIVGPLPDGGSAATAPIWSHAHAMVPVTPGATGGQPDETVAAYGPDVSFTYTFPLPGRYRIWVQAERDYAIITVPTTVDVSGAR